MAAEVEECSYKIDEILDKNDDKLDKNNDKNDDKVDENDDKNDDKVDEILDKNDDKVDENDDKIDENLIKKDDKCLSAFDKITQFLEKKKAPFKQGGEEWRRARTIGGSDTGTILGVNHFSDFRQWMAGKIGIKYDDELIVGRGGKKDVGFMRARRPIENIIIDESLPEWKASSPDEAARNTIRTRWGKLFEEVVRDLSFQIYKLKSPIVGHDTFIIHDKHLCYSPDGLAVADPVVLMRRFPENEKLKEIINNSGEKEMIILFEFKCPLTRKIGRSIPDHYEAQPLTGMGVINICQAAIFFESTFRVCSMEQLHFGPEYRRTDFIFDDVPLVGKYRPNLIDICKYDNKRINIEAIGFIVFYSRRSNFEETTSQASLDVNSSLCNDEENIGNGEDDLTIAELLLKKFSKQTGEIGDKNNLKIIDLGAAGSNTKILNILVTAADAGEIDVFYSNSYLKENVNNYPSKNDFTLKNEIIKEVKKINSDNGSIAAAVLPWKLIKFGEHLMFPNDEIFNMVERRAKVVYDSILKAKAAENINEKFDIIDETYSIIKNE
jgi:hypothetical protein